MKFYPTLVCLLATVSTSAPSLAATRIDPSFSAVEQQYSNEIPFYASSADADRASGIHIRRVLGDRKQLEPGGTYLIEGDFLMGPGSDASLTAVQHPAKAMEWALQKSVPVHAGTGHFALIAKMHHDGAITVILSRPDPSPAGLAAASRIWLAHVRVTDGHQDAVAYDNWHSSSYLDARPVSFPSRFEVSVLP